MSLHDLRPRRSLNPIPAPTRRTLGGAGHGSLSAETMGVRIEVYFAHDLPHVDETADVLSRLQTTLTAAYAVRDYWRSVGSVSFDVDQWEAEPTNPRTPAIRR